LIIAAGVVIAAPTSWIAASALTRPFHLAQTNKNESPTPRPQEPAKSKHENVAKRPVAIQGKPLADWIAALKDPDPAVRRRAVEVLGKVTRDQAGDQFSDIHARILGLMSSDTDRAVRRAAAAIADEIKLENAPGIKRRVEEERKRAVGPTLTPIRLVDTQGRPVSGAVLSDYFSKDSDRESSFTPSDDSKTSDAQGEVALKLEIPGHLEGTGLFAIQRAGARPLVGLRKVTREEIGKPITVTLYPACRVIFRIDSSGLPALKRKYNAELTGPGWWRGAYVRLGGDFARSPRPLFAGSTTGAFEFLLPPGRFAIWAYGSDAGSEDRPLEVKPGDRELILGTIDVSPSEDAKKGRFPDHHRVRLGAEAGGKRFVFRRTRFLPLRGRTLGACDVAFSPDGKMLATAHSYNTDPGEVKLWDTATGAQLATLPVPDQGVVTVAFSPDGKYLAGRAYAMADPGSSRGIILWDIASRREVQTFRGHKARISALVFSPDGKTLASSGADKTTRFWDTASWREIGRIEGNLAWGRSIAYSPDGQALAIGAGPSVELWDVPSRRLRATLEPETERFRVQAVAYSPDGATVAAAGSTYVGKGTPQQAQVRLYDVAHQPFRRRVELGFDSENPGGLDPKTAMCSDVAFTPDGRRVVAVAMQDIRTWDVATGIEQTAFQRGSSSSSDRLAVSPDGRWMAITGPVGQLQVVDIPPLP
jgi:WD40 repeat protein